MITKERLKELEKAESKLNALENGGVDNWRGYDDALEEYNKDIDRDEKIEELFNKIEEAFFEGSYEPSERGAGFMCTDEARENAKDIFMGWMNSPM